MKINLENSIKNDKYTEYIYDTFDIQNREKTETEISFNLSEAKSFDWNIGIIYGSSGSGKTSILKQMGNLYLRSMYIIKYLTKQRIIIKLLVMLIYFTFTIKINFFYIAETFFICKKNVINPTFILIIVL